MNELEQTSLEAVKLAVANKPPSSKLSYTEVTASDVVRLAALVPPSDQADELVQALADGAKNALKGWNEARRGPLKVWQTTSHLRHLVFLVEKAHPPAPPPPAPPPPEPAAPPAPNQ